MIRLLPRTPRGTWLLAGAVWLAGCSALWWVLPYRPRAAWATEEPAVVHGFIPGTAVVLISMPWSSTIDGPPGPMLGPLVARDTATGQVREWFPDGERLTLVEIAPDGRHVLNGRVLGGRARLFLHDAADGKVVAELPLGGPRAENENDQPSDAYEQIAAFRPDGQQIVYADRVGDERWLRVWDVDAHQEVAALHDAGPVAAWSPNGQLLAYVAHIGQPWTVRLWDLSAGYARAPGASPFEKNSRPVRIRFSPDGASIVCVLRTGERIQGREPADEIVGFDTASGRQTFHRSVAQVVFPANVPWFATVESTDSPDVECFHRCDYATGEGRDRLVLNAIAGARWGDLSPDGGLVLGDDVSDNPVFEFLDLHFLQGALGTNVRPALWEAARGRLLHVLPMALASDADRPTRHAWSPDGRLLAIAGVDDVMVWDVPPRRSLKWLMAGATLFALPPFVIARRRVRRLWREAAA
jgi:WD40 repeat protein